MTIGKRSTPETARTISSAAQLVGTHNLLLGKSDGTTYIVVHS